MKTMSDYRTAIDNIIADDNETGSTQVPRVDYTDLYQHLNTASTTGPDDTQCVMLDGHDDPKHTYDIPLHKCVGKRMGTRGQCTFCPPSQDQRCQYQLKAFQAWVLMEEP